MTLTRVRGSREMHSMLAAAQGPCFFFRDAPPGAHYDWRFYFTAPSAHVRSGFEPFWAAVKLGGRMGEVHGFDGEFDAPTLRPSVLCVVGKEPVWHGWVRQGRLVAA